MARAPQPELVDPTILVEDVAIDAEHVIVATRYDVPLALVKHDGTGKRILVKRGGVSRVIADDRGIFIASDRGLARVEKSGKTIPLAKPPPWALVLDATHVYGSTLGNAATAAGVFRVPRAGGEIEWLVTERSVTALGLGARGILYFASEGALHVRTPRGVIDAIAPAKNPHAIAVHGDAVVWTEFDETGAVRCFANGAMRTLAAHPYASDLVVLGDRLYWTQSSRKKSQPGIWRMRLTDGSPEPVARFAGAAPRLAATPTRLVWCGDRNGGVHALPLQPPASGASR